MAILQAVAQAEARRQHGAQLLAQMAAAAEVNKHKTAAQRAEAAAAREASAEHVARVEVSLFWSLHTHMQTESSSCALSASQQPV